MTRHHRRAFTMLELVLASVVASMILLVAGAIFLAAERSERASAAAFERTSQVEVTQGTMRRAFLRLVMTPNVATPPEVPPRPRMLLSDDGAATGAQRFELVVSKPPVAPGLAGAAGSAAFASEDSATLNFLSADGSGGQVRGVFELRPDGSRERVMAALGVANALWDLPPDLPYQASPPIQSPPPGWTLWWRRLPADEIAALQAGVPVWRDGEDPDPAFEAQRLAGSIRLMTGLTQARWRVFRQDQWVETFEGTMANDLPAYLQFNAVTREGDVFQWLFEVDWTESVQVGTDAEADAILGVGDAAGGGDGGTGGEADAQNPGTTPGQQDGRPGSRPGDRPGSRPGSGPGSNPGANPGDGGTTNPPRPGGWRSTTIRAFREGYER